MRKIMKNIAAVLGAIGLIALMVFIFVFTQNQDYSQIRDWTDQHDYVIESIEKPLFSTGPYWVKEDHHRIYKVDLKHQDKDVWFRFGSWSGPSIEWY